MDDVDVDQTLKRLFQIDAARSHIGCQLHRAGAGERRDGNVAVFGYLVDDNAQPSSVELYVLMDKPTALTLARHILAAAKAGGWDNAH